MRENKNIHADASKKKTMYFTLETNLRIKRVLCRKQEETIYVNLEIDS